MNLHRIVFDAPFVPGRWDVQALGLPSDAVATWGLFPVSPTRSRAMLRVSSATQAWVMTRDATAPQWSRAHYAPRHIAAEDLLDALVFFLSSEDVRLVSQQDTLLRLVFGDREIRLSEPPPGERLTVWDPAHWALSTDLRLDVRLLSFSRALQILRGPGRTLRGDAAVDLFFHDPLPVELPGIPTTHARVVTAQRMDTLSRTEFVGICTERFIESSGLRVSLPSLLSGTQQVLGVLAGPADTDHLYGPVVSFGADACSRAVWLGQLRDAASWTRWHADPQMVLHSSEPCAPAAVEPSCSVFA